MNERVDQVLESCIEVESNRRLLDENLNYLTLTFKDSKMERNVSRENCSYCAVTSPITGIVFNVFKFRIENCLKWR